LGARAEKWREQGFDDRWAFTKAGAQGFLLGWADEKYGAAGVADFRFEQIVYEENIRHGEPGFYLQLHSVLVAPYIGKSGDEEQKARWLPACVRGEKILAIAMTDPARQRSRRYAECGCHVILSL
jgi:alkylation response protein AidB-like acyl-CoA dehydrogenase